MLIDISRDCLNKEEDLINTTWTPAEGTNLAKIYFKVNILQETVCQQNAQFDHL